MSVGPALDPVPGVVELAGGGEPVAAGGDAAAVAQGAGTALGEVPLAGGAAEVEDLGARAQHGGDDQGVAGDLAQRRGGQTRAGGA